MFRLPVPATLLHLLPVLVLTGSAVALEKVSRPALDPADDWSASTTGTFGYYNICTGWVWVWSGWADGETLGTNFARPFPFYFLNVSWALTFSGVPSGYGFTGTISAIGGQNCAAPVLASQPYLPPVASGWNATLWGGLPVPNQFSVLISWAAPTGFTNSTGLASDHPFAGPTGPTSRGTCFPTTRVVQSRYYGVGGAYCPSGTTLTDGLCDIEWLIGVNAKLADVLVDESWGKVKALFR
jgi:hypothetical protein